MFSHLRLCVCLLVAVAWGIALAGHRDSPLVSGFGDKSVALVADEMTVQVGLDVMLTATLSDRAVGVPVQFTVDGQNLGDPVNTDNQGIAVKVYVPAAQGTITLKATATGYTGSNTVDVTGVTLTVKAKRIGESNWADGDVNIAAGAVNSDVHKAAILLEASPAVAAKVRVSLGGGQGHAGQHNAHATFGSNSIEAGQSQDLRTGTSGTLEGTLKSSDLIDGSVSIQSGSSSKTVYFRGDNYGEEDAWVSSEEYIVLGGTSIETVTFKFDGQSLDGHVIAFFVEEVHYIDENGEEQILYNTPSEPSDLSEWASFSPVECTTDNSGQASSTLTMADRPEMTLIIMRAYDLTTWTE